MADKVEKLRLQDVASGDFTALAEAFSAAGLVVSRPAHGVLQVMAAQATSARPGRPRILLSAGVHGDETAPIAMLVRVLDVLAGSPQELSADLLLVLGNPQAIGAGVRFVEADLNRMFREDRADLASAAEAARADAIMLATDAFFGGARDGEAGERWHLDLHSAIRASRYPNFAVVPALIATVPTTTGRRARLLDWLAHAGIDAAILNPTQAGTYSGWTAARHGALGATLELGRVAVLGASAGNEFARTEAALLALLRGRQVCGDAASEQGSPRMELFRVVRELRKHSARFSARFAPEAQNFTAFAPGSLIAEDGDVVYRAGAETEYVVFPNPDVRPGLRAGLMVVQEPAPLSSPSDD